MSDQQTEQTIADLRNAMMAVVPTLDPLRESREAFLTVWYKDSFNWTPDGTFGTHNWQATCWEIWKRGVQFGASNNVNNKKDDQ